MKPNKMTGTNGHLYCAPGAATISDGDSNDDDEASK